MNVVNEFYSKFISLYDLSNIFTDKLKLLDSLKMQLNVNDVENSALSNWHDGMFDVILKRSNDLLNVVGKSFSSSKKILISFCS